MLNSVFFVLVRVKELVYQYIPAISFFLSPQANPHEMSSFE